MYKCHRELVLDVSVESPEIDLDVSSDSGEVDLPVMKGQEIRMENDYEHLINRPRINDVELIGNMLLSSLFPEGIILDGGNTEGVG